MPKPEDVIIKEFDKQMDAYIDRVFQLSQEKLIEDGKVDTGNLLQSGNVNRKLLDKEIVYATPYADVIEFGRLPGTMPPVQALVKWIQRKLGIKNKKQAKKVAWAIAMAIKNRGMDASPYITPSFKQANQEFGVVER